MTTSKWIIELFNMIGDSHEDYSEVSKLLERIDKLLRMAMHNVDDENLHDELYKEIAGEPKLTTDNFGEFEDEKA